MKPFIWILLLSFFVTAACEGPTGPTPSLRGDAAITIVHLEKGLEQVTSTRDNPLFYPFITMTVTNTGTKTAHLVSVKVSLLQEGAILEYLVFTFDWIEPGETSSLQKYLMTIGSHDEYDNLATELSWAYED